MKTDIDFITIKDGKISSIWEIKRSEKVKVGTWSPYINPTIGNDINNYYMLISLSNLLKVKMVTVHHEEMKPDVVFTGEEKVDFFIYKPKPDIESLALFAQRGKSTTGVINDVLNLR
jgi:hypothetical protein